MRYLPVLTLVFALVPFAAQAQDQGVCEALGNIMPGANSGFAQLKGDKTDKNVWAASYNLPYAHECELRWDKDDKYMSYVCYYRVGADRDAKAEMANYATNVAACRPDMARSGEGDFIEIEGPQGEIAFSFNDSYPHEFGIYITPAGR